MSLVDGIFGGLFGVGFADLPAGMTQQDVAARWNAVNARAPTVELPVGIFWTRTGANTHRVVIRRQPERVPDYSYIANMLNWPIGDGAA